MHAGRISDAVVRFPQQGSSPLIYAVMMATNRNLSGTHVRDADHAGVIEALVAAGSKIDTSEV